jgi:tRNA nucleotidyltransferase (CCA-adding enzyme)
LDFSVEGDAVAFARQIASETGGEITAHSRFGTATVLAGETRVDLVTARGENYPRPGQLPEVWPGSIADDLARRDFTINAMAFPVAPGDGSLLDPLGGLDDLESGTVRVLHPRSFVDDPTRMFRAVRYEQRFGFRIAETTLECMGSAINGGLMNAVSGDRWRHEIERSLDEVDPGRSLLRASELGLLTGLDPALARDSGLKALATCHGKDVGRDVLADEWLAAIFAPLTAVEGEALIERLRLSGQRATLARDTIVLEGKKPQVRLASGSPSELFHLLAGIDPVAMAFHSRVAQDGLVTESLCTYLKELQYTRPSLTGDHLLDIGVPQGPVIGEILSRLRDARLDGVVSSEDEERALAREWLTRNLEGAAK